MLPIKRAIPGIAVIALALVVSMGAHTPLFDIYLLIPGANLFRAPGRTALLVTFFGAHLAAATLDAVITKVGPRKPALVSGAAILLVLLTVADLYHYGRRFLDTGPADKFFFPPKIEAALLENAAPGMRMIAPTNGRRMNHAGLFDLGTPAGYDIFIDRRYAEFLNRSQGRSPDSFISMERLRRGSPLARRMGASLLLSTLPPRNGRTVPAHGHPGFKFVTVSEGLYLYRDPSPEPRVALVHEAVVYEDKETLFKTLAAPGFDISRVALLEAPLPDSFPKPAPRIEGDERAEIVHYSPNRVEIEVDAKSASILVLSDSLMPGWRAEVDGRSVPMVHADWVMRAVPVPAGKSTVVMTYLPRPFVVGAAVSLLSGLLLLGFAITEHRRRRRQHPPADPS